MRALLLLALVSTVAAASSPLLLRREELMDRPTNDGRPIATLWAGTIVEVELCNLEKCLVRSAAGRGYVPRQALGDAHARATLRAQNSGTLQRSIDTRAIAADVEHQTDRLRIPNVQPVAALDFRLGLVGITLVEDNAGQLVRDGEEVTALCADGARRLTAHVRSKPVTPGRVAISLSVDCEAELVVAGTFNPALPPLARLTRRSVQEHRVKVTTADFDGDGHPDEFYRDGDRLWLLSASRGDALAVLTFAEGDPPQW